MNPPFVNNRFLSPLVARVRAASQVALAQSLGSRNQRAQIAAAQFLREARLFIFSEESASRGVCQKGGEEWRALRVLDLAALPLLIMALPDRANERFRPIHQRHPIYSGEEYS